MLDLILWKQETPRKDKIDKQIENSRINYDFPRDSALSLRHNKLLRAKAKMKQWQVTGKRGVCWKHS